MNKTILVIGGAGYIGSVVAKQLIDRGYKVIIVDNFSTGFRQLVNPTAKLYQCSCGDIQQMNQIFQENKIDVVMHFAAFALVGESVGNPRKYYQNNVIETINLLNTMLDNDCNRFIFSSTCATYGEPQYSPMDEEHPQNPINPYGFTKMVVEKTLIDYNKAYELKFNAFRYFNAAGASDKYGELHNPETHIIPLLLKTASGEREFFTLFGDDYPTQDGTCIRDYIHVLDLADAHIIGIDNLENNPGEFYNLGTGNGFSNNQVIESVKTLTSKDFEVRKGERREGDPAVLIAKAVKAKKELNWIPKFSSLGNIIKSALVFNTNLKN